MLKIRLKRVGRKHDPSFRVIVTEAGRGIKSGKYIEMIGSYDPRVDKNEINKERANYWLSNGAQPSDTVYNLLVDAGVVEGKKKNVLPKKSPIISEAEASAEEPQAAAVEAPAAEEVSAAEEVAESALEEAPAEVVEEAKDEAPATEAETAPEEPAQEAAAEEVVEETPVEAEEAPTEAVVEEEVVEPVEAAEETPEA